MALLPSELWIPVVEKMDKAEDIINLWDSEDLSLQDAIIREIERRSFDFQNEIFKLATKRGDLDLVEILIYNYKNTHNKKINSRGFDWTIGLKNTAEFGDLDMFEFLIDNIYYPPEIYSKIFEPAIIGARLNIVNIVLDKLNHINWTMTEATAIANINKARLGSRSVTDINWNNVFSDAFEGGNMDIIQLVLKNMDEEPSWLLAFDSALRGGHLNIVKFVRSQIDNIAHRHWNSFFYSAVRSQNSEEMVKYIFDQTNNLNIRLNLGAALHNAASAGNIKTVKSLFRNRNNHNYNYNGFHSDLNQGLLDSARIGNIELIKFFIDKAKELYNLSVLDFHWALRIANENQHDDLAEYIEKIINKFNIHEKRLERTD